MSLSLPLILLLGLAGALCVVMVVWGAYLATTKTQVAAEPETAAKAKKDDETFILHQITERLGRPFLRPVLEAVGEERRAGIQVRIDAAGRPEDLTVERYVSRKIGEVLLYGTLAVLLFMNGSTMFALIILAFTALTDYALYSEARKRQDQIQRQLPDFLDVLAVTVGAGLSFRQALARVSDSMPGVLASEFQTTLQQMDLGTSRRDAFTALRARNSNESLGRFVSALQQAEELGAPLAQTLMTISHDMRREDAQYLRRKAQKLNPQVTGITAVTMLPGLLLLIGGGLFLGSNIDFGGVLGG
ncbi:tight adherence protein C [Spinactinospora alkalitolerans]|uniref:Tight adherence protein C n=1 Tax=Spinactinospora alkalitolerans TaxID=687207 RepID=A0A852U0T1_9ACTN|nr:type II secretion system F family protein [Spinactinospora alkalitolerans]NYE49167.1 tight adherence protein C [Spinactinospora alkalitolerans]